VRLPVFNYKSFLFVVSVVIAVLSPVSALAQQWGQYGRNAQHTELVTTPVQKLNAILWQTPVDLYPPYSGGDLFLHYGSSLISANGTVVVTVRTGSSGGTWPPAFDTYRIEGRDLGTGNLIYTENTDWSPPPYGWDPPCGSAIGPDNRVWTPGAGGTVYVRSSADSASASVTQLAFYGIANYTANTSLYNSDVKICTPITIDSSGNAYFGFWVKSGSTTGMTSGWARISAGGVGTYVSAATLTGLASEAPTYNASPAVSNDGTKLYVMAQYGGSNYTGTNLRVLELDSTALTVVNSIIPSQPSGSSPAFIDDGSGTIMVGSDGDIYVPSLSSGNLASRGFMMHYHGDLSGSPATLFQGAFGWDDTASLVPASAVPSYAGTSSYLILTKYNNYADPGCWGDGKNRIAILDPNASESYTVQYGSHYSTPNATGATYTTMKEILTILGQTPNANLYSDGTPYDGYREWCINSAVVSSASKAAIINSEDGHCYYWDLTTGTVTSNLNLEPPTGEAYTPTTASADGISFAVNNAQLIAMWDGAGPSSFGFAPATVSAGDGSTGTINLANTASVDATIKLTSGNPKIHVPATVVVPAGSNSATFPITTDLSDTNLTGTIIATRYNVTVSTNTFRANGSPIGAVNLASGTVNGGAPSSGAVVLSYPAPSAGRTVTVSSDLSCVHITNPNLAFAGGVQSQNFNFTTDAVSATVSGHIIATEDSGLVMQANITIKAPVLSNLTLSSSSVTGGNSVGGTITVTGNVPAAGIDVAMTYTGAHIGTGDPASVHVSASSTPITVHTSAVTTSENDSVSATFEGITKTANVTVFPNSGFTGFTVDNSSPYMSYQVHGTVTFSQPVGSNTPLTVTASDQYVAAVSQPVVLAGQSSAQFTMNTGVLPTGFAHNTTVTVSYQGGSFAQVISIQPIFLANVVGSIVNMTSNQVHNFTISLTPVGAGAYTIHPAVHCSDPNVTVPVQINFAAGVQTTILQVHTGTITTTGQANINIGPLCGGNKTVFVRYSP